MSVCLCVCVYRFNEQIKSFGPDQMMMMSVDGGNDDEDDVDGVDGGFQTNVTTTTTDGKQITWKML